MIEITFNDFHEYNYTEEGFELYIMKNGLGDVLYIGISSDNIWSRWFAYNGHMIWDGKYIISNSSVSQKIVDHLPASLEWKIQLWTVDDCVEFCKDVIPSRQTYTIKFLEPVMIQKLSPILNVIYNLNPGKDTTPKSKKETEREKLLDDVYKKVFENRK